MPIWTRPRRRKTLIIITACTVARVDFRTSSKLENRQIHWSRRSQDSDLADAVKQAIGLSQQPVGSLSLISTDFWIGLVSLPADIANVAEHQELQHALALEAELDSGIPAFHSKVAYQRIKQTSDGSVMFCAMQVADTWTHGITKAVSNLSGRLTAMAHPLATELDSLQESDVAILDRIAQWSHQSHQAGDSLTSPPEHASPSWLEELVERTILSGCCDLRRSKMEGGTCWIPVGSSAGWLGSKLTTFSLAAATALGCCGWQEWLNRQNNRLLKQIAELEQNQARQNEALTATQRIQSQLMSLRKTHEKAQQQLLVTQQSNQKLSRAQSLRFNRWPRLIDSISNSAGSCWVQRVDSDSKSASILGIASTSQEAQDFAIQLEQRLNETGWRVAPVACHVLPGGLYHFCITLSSGDSVENPQAGGTAITEDSRQDTKSYVEPLVASQQAANQRGGERPELSQGSRTIGQRLLTSLESSP